MRPFFTLIILVSLLGCSGHGPNAGQTLDMSSRHERRDKNTVLSDQTIEKSATMEINSHVDLRDADNIHFNIIAYNGKVLITGEATNTKLRDKLISLVRVIPNVKLVHDEITITPTESFSSRSNDTYLTTQVKSALQEIDNLPEFDAAMVQVVTESSVVYLIGIVHRAEGKAVAEKTQHVAGVIKIVTLFEYID